jgi:hypothetical protein
MEEKYAIVRIKDENGNYVYQIQEMGFSTKEDANDARTQKYNVNDYIIVLFWY